MRNEKGITLAEVLATLIIASLVISTITYVVQYALHNYRFASERQVAHTDALFVTETIVKAVRERSNQTLLQDASTNCILKLEVNSTTYTCFIFDHVAQTLHMTKVDDDVVVMSQLLSDKLHAVDIDITATKVDLALHYKLLKNSMYTHETAVYIPYL